MISMSAWDANSLVIVNVFNKQTGNPINGASVRLSDLNPLDPIPTKEQFTDPLGKTSFLNLRTSRYTLEVVAANYDTLGGSSEFSLAAFDPVTGAAGETKVFTIFLNPLTYPIIYHTLQVWVQDRSSQSYLSGVEVSIKPPGVYPIKHITDITGFTIFMGLREEVSYLLHISGKQLAKAIDLNVVLPGDSINHTIKVVVDIATYTLSLSNSYGGTAEIMYTTTAGSVSKTSTTIGVSMAIPTYTPLTISATPQSGYLFDYWDIRGVTVSDETKRTNPLNAGMPAASWSIKAVFKQEGSSGGGEANIIVTVNSSPGGAVTKVGQTLVPYGGGFGCEAQPDGTYYLKKWVVNGVFINPVGADVVINGTRIITSSSGAANTLNLSNITKNTVITPNFSTKALDKRTLTIQKVGSGETTPPPGSYDYYDEVSVNIIAEPEAGYIVKEWYVNGALAKAGDVRELEVTLNENTGVRVIFGREEGTPSSSGVTLALIAAAGVIGALSGGKKG